MKMWRPVPQTWTLRDESLGLSFAMVHPNDDGSGYHGFVWPDPRRENHSLEIETVRTPDLAMKACEQLLREQGVEL